MLCGLALYLIIAWRVLYLARLGWACPALPCTVLFSEDEWKAAVFMHTEAPPPEHPPTLGELVKIVAGFGNYLGRTGDGHPGITSLWIGLQRAMDFAMAYKMFGPGAKHAAEQSRKKRRKRMPGK